LNTSKSKVLYHLCRYTPLHPRSIAAERVLDAIEAHVHDNAGRFINRQYTNLELTTISLNHNGSSSNYAVRNMQAWITTHRYYHERAELEAARRAQIEAQFTVGQESEDLMELDEGPKGEDADQDQTGG
jgi:hypothetical protein